MGHAEMWAAMRERDAIYADPQAGEEEFLRAADLEAKYAEYGGYTAEARAGELLLGLGVPSSQHDGPMSAVAPGWKLRVLLAQALFGDPDILLLDEPTNNLDINSIRWLEDGAEPAHQHDGHHLARPTFPFRRLHAHGGRGLRRHQGLPGQLRRLYGSVDAGEAAAAEQERARQGPHRRPGGVRAALPRPQGQGAPGDFAHEADREAEGGGREALQPAVPVHPLSRRPEGEAAPARRGGEGPREGLRARSESFREARPVDRGGREGGDHRPERNRQDHALAVHR